MIERSRYACSEVRQHSALGYRQPAPETIEPQPMSVGLTLRVVQQEGVAAVRNIMENIRLLKPSRENFQPNDNGLDLLIDAWLDRNFPGRNIKRVLLVTPPDAEAEYFRYDTARRRRYPNYPPYGLAVLAKKLQSINVEVRITNLNHVVLRECCRSSSKEEFDFDLAWQNQLDQDIQAFRPDFVGVTCMFTMTHGSLHKVCSRLKRNGIVVGIGGVHVTNDVSRVLDDIPEVDLAFLNEGDIAIQRFVQCANKRIPVDQLGQVIFVDGEQRYSILRECRPSETDIDVIPAYELLEIREAADYGTIGAFYFLKPKATKFATVLSNRGCRAQCTFCSVPNFNGAGVRQRSVKSVVDELEILQDEYGVDHIMWLDDDLLKDNNRAINLFNEMVRRNLKLTWDATNGLIAHPCQLDVITAAAASGCIAVNIGMESGNPKILRDIKKPGRVDNFIKAAEVFRKFEKIHTSVQLMVGFPGETMRMVQDTINVAREMDLDWHRIAQLQPLPNTPIYDSMIAQGLVEPVGNINVRFTGGAFGKQVDIEQGRELTTPNFEDAFYQIKLDQVPTSEQLTDVWFYMNYHLNFHRLFTEKRVVKISQQLKNLQTLSDIISPENAFALYFLGYLQSKVYGSIDPMTISRLERRLETSTYWADRLKAFGLSISDLHTVDFKNKNIPRLVAGRLPDDFDNSPIIGM